MADPTNITAVAASSTTNLYTVPTGTGFLSPQQIRVRTAPQAPAPLPKAA